MHFVEYLRWLCSSCCWHLEGFWGGLGVLLCHQDLPLQKSPAARWNPFQFSSWISSPVEQGAGVNTLLYCLFLKLCTCSYSSKKLWVEPNLLFIFLPFFLPLILFSLMCFFLVLIIMFKLTPCCWVDSFWQL